MNDDFYDEFMPLYREISKERIVRLKDALGKRERERLLHELHSMAGESAVIGLLAIADMARDAHDKVKNGGEDAWADHEAWLSRLERAIAQV